jgi:hypothetical protein
LFDLPDAPRPDPDTPAPPRFLYDFENMLLSYADRSRVITTDAIRGVDARTQESLSTFTLDGFVAGTWGVQRDRRRATLTIKPLRPLARDQKTALEDEGDRLLDFLAADAADHDVEVGAAWT